MKFKIGIGIIILSFIASLNPYFLVFTIPIFLVGSLLVFKSNESKKKKLLWSVLPVLLWYPGIHLIYYLSSTIGTAYAQKLDLIFPSDFKGRAIIVSKMSCGQPVEIINDREQLVIPDNGILLYQGEIESGYVNHKYFFIDQNENKIEIPKREPSMYWNSEPNKPDTTIMGVWLGGMGSKHINYPKPEIEFNYMVITVSSKQKYNDYFGFHYLKQFENESDSLILKCKKK